MKLENENYMNVSFIVVNHHGEDSRAKYHELKHRVSQHIPVYQQEESQADIWGLLKGSKDDFFIYDRCGRLVKHIGLPFAFLQFSYVENAIKQVYCDSLCGECKHKTSDDVCKKEEEAPVQAKAEEEPDKHPHNHGRQHHHQEKETAVEDSGRPNVHGHKHHHRHHHHHKAEGCQTPRHSEPVEKVESVPERAIVPNRDTEGLENKL